MTIGYVTYVKGVRQSLKYLLHSICFTITFLGFTGWKLLFCQKFFSEKLLTECCDYIKITPVPISKVTGVCHSMQSFTLLAVCFCGFLFCSMHSCSYIRPEQWWFYAIFNFCNVYQVLTILKLSIDQHLTWKTLFNLF